MIRALILALALCIPIPAQADEPKLPNGLTCEDVRRTVAEIGKVRALALALENGASFAQIREARRCLR